MDVEKVFAILNTIGLLILGFLQWNNQRSQVQSQSQVGKADASEKITQAATKLVDELQTELTLLRPLVIRNTQLEAEVTNVRRANERLINWAERLVKQIEL